MTEEQLVLTYKETKDEELFNQIYDKYSNYIYDQANVRHFSRESKDDLAQNLTLKFLELIQNYDEEKGIFKKYVLSFLKWEAKRLIDAENGIYHNEISYDPYDMNKFEDESLEGNEDKTLEGTYKLIDEILPKQQAKVFKMKAIQNRRLKDIAKEMYPQISPKVGHASVDKHYRLAKKKLRKELDQ